MMAEIALEVHNVKLSYHSRQSYSIKNSLLQFRKSECKEIPALRGVTFDVAKGEVLGVVGRNGSGKSTLLQTLAGVFNPDAGTIDRKNNSISLLSLGSGFQIELTGRENIMLNGLLLGFSRAQMTKKMDEIIDFSELREFIDMPVRTYSSGMNSKLAFSITAIMETDIILIDEVLAVGDAGFRNKSYNKMRQLIDDRNRTAIVVSHQENNLRELCSRVMWIDDGLVREIGETNQVMDHYLESLKKKRI